MNQVLAFDLGTAVKLGNSTDNIASKYPNISTLVNIIVKNSIAVISVVLIALLIFGGLMFIIGAGSGDPKKAQQGQGIVTDALIGFAIVFLAFIIIQIIEIVTGYTILNSTL